MFTEINDSNFAENVSKGLSIVLFYKDKCPYCKAMKKILTKFSERPAAAGKDISYFQIKREDNPEMVESLQIERIPALIVYRDGEKIHTNSGEVTYKQLESMIA